MDVSKIRIAPVAYLLLTMTLAGFLMVVGRGLLIPIVFSIFFSLIIYPVCKFFEDLVHSRVASLLITFLLVTTVIGGFLWFFSRQFFPFLGRIDEMLVLSGNMLKEAVKWVASTFNMDVQTAQGWINTLSQRLLNYLLGSIPNPSIFLTTVGLLPIYSFLFLLYRTSFKNFILIQFSETHREKAKELIKEIQRVSQGYIYGLAVVILIVGLLNSFGLWAIGIDYPFFWGYLASILTVIPYIGTFIGGSLPFLYALLYASTVWQPVAVVILYVSVQQLEGNLITPKIIGSTVKVNPLIAIISLFFFGAIWGLAGLILALPMIGTIRVIFSHIEPLKPLAVLLGSHIYHRDDEMLNQFNEDRYRIVKNFLKNGK